MGPIDVLKGKVLELEAALVVLPRESGTCEGTGRVFTRGLPRTQRVRKIILIVSSYELIKKRLEIRLPRVGRSKSDR